MGAGSDAGADGDVVDDPDADPCGPDSDCINRALYIECIGGECRAGKHCHNQQYVKYIGRMTEGPRLIGGSDSQRSSMLMWMWSLRKKRATD